MKKSRILKSVVAVGLCIACVGGIAGCSSSSEEDTSGDVAATVNGTDIMEDTITTYIESFRTSYGLDEEEDWAEWLLSYDYTIESVREEVIDSYIDRELILAEAEEQGITVEDEEIDEYVDYMVEQLGSEEDWEAALEDAGMTEDEYREELEVQMIDSKLQDTFATDEEPSDEDMLSYAEMYASAYDGAKRSSQILFDADDEETAQEVLDQINNGEITFEEAVEEYSTDDTSKEEGGDVGWDAMNSFVDEYQDALDELEEGEISGLVESDYGIHIIECTEVYNAPTTTDDDGEETIEITSIDDIPEDWAEEIEESLIELEQEEAYDEWLEEAYEEADITINDMPDGLSYYVDLSLYEEEDEGSSDSGSTTDDESTEE